MQKSSQSELVAVESNSSKSTTGKREKERGTIRDLLLNMIIQESKLARANEDLNGHFFYDSRLSW